LEVCFQVIDGGLDMGIKDVLDAETVWFSEFDKAPSKILAHHWPDIPNHGDITQIDWANVEPVDILTGGFPCQDVSLAGARAGLKDGTRSGLWSEFARAIEVLKPRLVVIENVRGLLSAAAGGSVESDPWGVGDGATRSVVNALGAVLGDLVSLGYDAQWCGVRAADAGAPHGRYRIFIVAYPNGRRDGGWPFVSGDGEGTQPDVAVDGADHRFGGTGETAATRNGTTADTSGDEPERWGGAGVVGVAAATGEVDGEERQRVRDTVSNSGATATNWGVYEPAIRRWEHLSGRVAPPATDQDWAGFRNRRLATLLKRQANKMPIGMRGSLRAATRLPGHRLSARFVEWMMGLPVGHVTDPAIGLTRNEQLKALGNGVVPQQASLALRTLLASSVGVSA
jgi:DNA (cytosine-5)-methyltransferase 1